MNTTLLAVILVAAIIIVVAVVALVRRSTGLRPLPEEARHRYADEWRQIEARFVDEPQEAVHAADQLVVAIVAERGGREDRLPSEVGRARAAVADQRTESLTENLRQAMIEYRQVVGQLLGTDPRETVHGRTEVAS